MGFDESLIDQISEILDIFPFFWVDDLGFVDFSKWFGSGWWGFSIFILRHIPIWIFQVFFIPPGRGLGEFEIWHLIPHIFHENRQENLWLILFWHDRLITHMVLFCKIHGWWSEVWSVWAVEIFQLPLQKILLFPSEPLEFVGPFVVSEFVPLDFYLKKVKSAPSNLESYHFENLHGILHHF